MNFYTSLMKIAKKNPTTLAARYTASPNILRDIPKGGIIDLTMSSSSSPEHELQVVPTAVSRSAVQTANECPISSVPITAKDVQGTSQMIAENCPISSVPIKEKRREMNQSNTETSPISTVPIAEKSETPTNKEEDTEATSLGTTSVRAEQKSEVVENSDDSRQEKRRSKRSAVGDKDSQVSSSSNKSPGRRMRQTQFFGSQLNCSVKNVEGKSGEEKLQTIPISPGDIPSSSGSTPSELLNI